MYFMMLGRNRIASLVIQIIPYVLTAESIVQDRLNSLAGVATINYFQNVLYSKWLEMLY